MCPGPKGAPRPVGPAWEALAPVFVPAEVDPPLLVVPLPETASETTVDVEGGGWAGEEYTTGCGVEVAVVVGRDPAAGARTIDRCFVDRTRR